MPKAVVEEAEEDVEEEEDEEEVEEEEDVSENYLNIVQVSTICHSEQQV